MCLAFVSYFVSYPVLDFGRTLCHGLLCCDSGRYPTKVRWWLVAGGGTTMTHVINPSVLKLYRSSILWFNPVSIGWSKVDLSHAQGLGTYQG